MGITRSKVVELSSVPAIAYKVRLKTGGSGIKFHRTDKEESAFALIDKRSGEAMLDERVKSELFPEEALLEATELLVGLPYSARGKVKFIVSETVDDDEVCVPEDEAPETHSDTCANVIDSDEFVAIVGMYSDVNGKMNYQLMNKQFIQFASKNKTVTDLVGKRASVDEILLSVVKNRASFLAGKRENLGDNEALALIDAIEDIDPRSAFKELKLHIRKLLAR